MNKDKITHISFFIFLTISAVTGTIAAKGEIQPVQLLDPPPRSISPGVFQVFPDKILFSWPEVEKASLYHIEISNSESYSTLIVEAEISENNLLVDELPEDIYFWRVSCINQDGLEGRFSQSFIFYHIK